MDRLIEMIINHGIIEEKDREIYAVAIPSLLFSLLTWGSFFLLSVFLRITYVSILFLLFYIPLRIYAGGFHQNTREKCYVHSLFIFFILMIGFKTWIKIWVINDWTVLLVVSCIIIWFLAPLEAINKPLNAAERRHHKVTARLILMIEVVIVALFRFGNFYNCQYFSVMSILLVAIHLVLGALSSRNELNM